MSEWNWVAIVNFLAILFGPIIAIFLSKYLDNKRNEREEKRQILTNLMACRAPTDEHRSRILVDNLNLIPIYFSKDKKVLKILEDYIDKGKQKGLDFDSRKSTQENYIPKIIGQIAICLGYKEIKNSEIDLMNNCLQVVKQNK